MHVTPLPPPDLDRDELSQGRIARAWWPLACSWLLMGLELPMLTIAVARLPDPEVHLAAHGALVLPISLIVEAPIMMLLAASTALCADARSHRLVRRFMLLAGGGLTAVHGALAFTPLFDLLARDLLGIPEATVEPARLGLRILLPWTWAIAYRRFHQGILIRFGRSRPVAAGTLVRLVAGAAVLVAGVVHGGLPGIAVGAAGMAAGVTAEAAYIGWVARPVVRRRLSTVGPGAERLTWRAFLAFYVPLALTQLLSLSVPPLSAAALSRMPDPLTSLAAWPAAFGLVFVLRSVSYAYNEVVVSLSGEPGAARELRRFAGRLAGGATAFLVVFVSTPLADAWFRGVSGLPPELATTCRLAVAVALFQPALAAAEHWLQGVLVHRRHTRAITIGMAVYLAATALGYTACISWGAWPGIYLAVATLTLAAAAKSAWLLSRARPWSA